MDSDAGRLLLERLPSSRRGVDLYAACVATGGVPLAIELAATTGMSPDVAQSIESLVDAARRSLPPHAQHALAALSVAVAPISPRLALAATASEDAIEQLVARGLLVRLDGGDVRMLPAVRDVVARSVPADVRRAVLNALLDECLCATRDAASLVAFEPVVDTATALLHEDALPVDQRQRLAAQLAPWWQGRLGPARARELLVAALGLGETGPASAALHLALAATPDADVRDTERHLRDAARVLGSHDAVDPDLIQRLKRAAGAAIPEDRTRP